MIKPSAGIVLFCYILFWKDYQLVYLKPYMCVGVECPAVVNFLQFDGI